MTTEVEAKAQRLSDALSAVSKARGQRDACATVVQQATLQSQEAEAEVARVETEFNAALADLLAPAEAAQADVGVAVDPQPVGVAEVPEQSTDARSPSPV